MPSSIVGVDEIEDVLKRIENEDVNRYRALEEEQAAQEQQQTQQQEQTEQPQEEQ
jgi:hypothetical protein